MLLSNDTSLVQPPAPPVPQSFLPLVVLFLTVILVAIGSSAAISTLAQGATPIYLIILQLCSGAFLASLIFVQQFKEELHHTWRQATRATQRLLANQGRFGKVGRATTPSLVTYSGVTSS